VVKLIVAQLVRKFPGSYGTRMFRQLDPLYSQVRIWNLQLVFSNGIPP